MLVVGHYFLFVLVLECSAVKPFYAMENTSTVNPTLLYSSSVNDNAEIEPEPDQSPKWVLNEQPSSVGLSSYATHPIQISLSNTSLTRESDKLPFDDNSDSDPNFNPTENEQSESESSDYEPTTSNKRNERNDNNTKIKRKRKSATRSDVRKRSRNISIDTKSKTLLNLGMEHTNRKGNIIPERKIGAACEEKCRIQCQKKFNEEARKSIFKEFWDLADHTRQWDFIAKYVKEIKKKQVTVGAGSVSRRSNSRYYVFKSGEEDKRVCKTMFLNTLGVSETWVTTALKKIKGSSTIIADQRGKHNNRPEKIKETIKDSVRNHIKLFPAVPSHYVRKNSHKMYYEEGLSIQKMYGLYNDYCIEAQIDEKATVRQYRDIFNGEFNISFFKPKKDQCDFCSIYSLSDETKKLEIKNEYDIHIKNKILARELKDGDKITAIDDKTV